MKSILNEIEAIYSTIQPKKQKEFIHKIIKCNGTIVGLGAGRMGYSLQAFVMRLSHFGYRSFMIGDTSIPMITEEDLIIVNSSSGNTKSIVLLTEIAKKNGAKIISLTGNGNSLIAKLSDFSLVYEIIDSKQLMKSVYEQFTFLFFDHCAAMIAKENEISKSEIENNHSVLE